MIDSDNIPNNLLKEWLFLIFDIILIPVSIPIPEDIQKRAQDSMFISLRYIIQKI